MKKFKEEFKKWPLKEGSKTSYGCILKIYETDKQNIKFVLIKNDIEPFANTYSLYKYDDFLNGGTYSTFHFVPDYVLKDISNHVEGEKFEERSLNKKEESKQEFSTEQEKREDSNKESSDEEKKKEESNKESSDKEGVPEKVDAKINKNKHKENPSYRKNIKKSDSSHGSMFETDRSSENDEKKSSKNKQSPKKAKIKVNHKNS